MYYAVVSNQNRSTAEIPIMIGPIVEMAVDRVEVPFFIDFLFGLVIRRAIRKAFYDAELKAKTETIKLPSRYN